MHNDAQKLEQPNLYLLGFMGTGKTVLGKRVAYRLGYRFIDSDREIEKLCAMPTKDIFEKFGEAKFRQLEREFIERGHPKFNCVISCGGGLSCRDDMPELVKSKGVCVVLFSTPEEIYSRTSRNNSRPLLNVENPIEKIKTLLKDRTPFYMRSGVAIAADKNLKVTEERILRIYNAAKRRLAKAEKTSKLS